MNIAEILKSNPKQINLTVNVPSETLDQTIDIDDAIHMAVEYMIRERGWQLLDVEVFDA